MGHKGGGRHDGAQGERRVRRREEKAAQRLAAVAEAAGRAVIREAAALHSKAAVQTIAKLMEHEDAYIQLAASREILKIANAYPTKNEVAGDLGNGNVQVYIQNYNGKLPTQMTVAALPAQTPLTPPPVTEAEFARVEQPPLEANG